MNSERIRWHCLPATMTAPEWSGVQFAAMAIAVIPLDPLDGLHVLLSVQDLSDELLRRVCGVMGWSRDEAVEAEELLGVKIRMDDDVPIPLPAWLKEPADATD